MAKKFFLIVCPIIGVISLLLAVIVVLEPSLTPLQQSWWCQFDMDRDSNRMQLKGQGYSAFTRGNPVGISAVFPAKLTEGFMVQSSGQTVHVTGRISHSWTQPAYFDDGRDGGVYLIAEYMKGGVAEFGINDYRLTLLEGGRILRIGDEIIELHPGDQVEITFTTPDEFSVTGRTEGGENF